MKLRWMIAFLSVSAIGISGATGQTTLPAAVADAVLATRPASTVPVDDASIPQEPDTAQIGRNLPRTMALLTASQQGDIQPIRILFYGQSIVAQAALQNTLLTQLRQAYPKADIIPINNAIGGYVAPKLVRTMIHDIVPCRPDLIVFHDYGGETDGTYEQIIRFIRSQTTAEVLMWNHHLDNYGDKVDADRERESAFRRQIAAQYACEFADVRWVWKRYLQQHALPRTALLKDRIHNTDAGCQIMARILARHFVQNPAAMPPDHAVRTISLADSAKWRDLGVTLLGPWRPSPDGQGIELTAADSRLELQFTGVRVDVIGPPDAADASAHVLIDGQPPSASPGLWITTRPSRGPVGWFPGLNRVSLGNVPMVCENWTLHCFDIAQDGRSFKFQLVGSQTGPDGQGDSTSAFVSRSKRIRLEPGDFSFALAFDTLKKALPSECQITWQSSPLGLDEYRRHPEDRNAGGDRQTLVNGLPNQPHRLSLIAQGNRPLSVRALIVHRPDEQTRVPQQ